MTTKDIAPLPNSTLRVLQWNVWMEEEPRRIAEVLGTIRPDIACLQEVVQPRHPQGVLALASRIADLRGVYACAHTIPVRGRTVERGNAVLTRHAVRSRRIVPLRAFSRNVTTNAQQGRVYIECDVETGGGADLTVGCVHLSYVPGFGDPDWKLAEFDILAAAIGDRRRNMLLAGDFNATPSSLGFERLPDFVSAGPPVDQPTWTTKPYRDSDFAESALRWRLDHVLVTPDVSVVAVEVISTDVSDHLPLLITLEAQRMPG